MQTGGPPDPVKQLGTYNPDPIPEGADEVDGEADKEGDVVGADEDGGAILVIGDLVEGAAVGLVEGQISSVFKHLRSPSASTCTHVVPSQHLSQPPLHNPYSGTHWLTGHDGEDDGDELGEVEGLAVVGLFVGLFVGLEVDGELLGLVVGALIGEADGD